MNKVLKNHLDLFFRDLTSLGTIMFYFFILVTLLIFQQSNMFFQLLAAFLFIMLISILIRIFHYKDRPHKEPFHNFLEKLESSAFPSVHTARSIFLALFFINYFQHLGLSIFIALLAILISYSRIYLQKHDWLDLLGGVILAVITFGLTFYLF